MTILTKTKFKKWLESKGGREIVGYRAEGHSCPVANCLHDNTGDRWTVWPDLYFVTDVSTAKERIESPSWMSRFVSGVDGSGKHYTGITAAKALEILEQI